MRRFFEYIKVLEASNIASGTLNIFTAAVLKSLCKILLSRRVSPMWSVLRENGSGSDKETIQLASFSIETAIV